MKVYGKLERAQIETVSALPTSGDAFLSRVVYLDTIDGANAVGFYIHNGTTWKMVTDISTTQTLTGKTIDADLNTITNIENADIKTGAAIDRAKIASGSNDHVVINSGAGALSSEAQLAKTRGGTGVSSTATFPTSGVVVTEAGAQTLTNKTLTTPVIDVVSLTDQSSVAAPSAGTTKIYSKTDGKIYKQTSIGEQEIGSGAGGGSINYISSNPDAESATTGWATYKDAAAATPVDGTGGTATLTFTRSTSSPLRGVGSFLITTTAANLQGEGASFDFTVPLADAAKPISVSFDYNIASGTYVTGDMTVYIYDVTNSALIQPDVYQIQAMGSTIGNKHVASFQTSATGTSYRLIFHRAVTTSSAMTMKLDNVQVGPSEKPDIAGLIAFNGRKTGTQSLAPNNSSVDVTFVTTASGAVGFDTSAAWDGTSTWTCPLTGYYRASALLETASTNVLANDYYLLLNIAGTTYELDFIRSAVTTPLVMKGSNLFYITAGQAVKLQLNGAGNNSASQLTATTNCRFSIERASALNVGAESRVCAFQARLSGNQSIASASATKITFDTMVSDTHGAFSSGSTRYNVPVAGSWVFGATAYLTSVTASDTYDLYIYKNGVAVHFQGFSPPSTLVHASVVTPPINCVAGDYIEVYIDSGTDNAYTVFASTQASLFYGNRLSGPSAIAASETMAASAYRGSTAQTITAGANTAIVFNTKEQDTHGQFSTSTGLLTVQSPGKIQVCFNVQVLMGATAASTLEVWVWKNGTGKRYGYALIDSLANAKTYTLTGSPFIQCVAGDTLGVYIASATQNVTVQTTGGTNDVSSVYFTRIGNY